MKKPLLVLLGSICVSVGHAQFFSSANVYIGSDAVVTANTEVINHGNLKSDGVLHLRSGLDNQGQLLLNGQVVMDGTGSQSLESTTPIKVGSLVMAQTGKVSLQTTLTVVDRLTFGKGIIESSKQFPLAFGDNAQVVGASNRSHVKGYVQKLGDDAFDFPVGDGSMLHTFSVSKPADYDQILVGFVGQNPSRLSAKRSAEVADITAHSYWDVRGVNAKNELQVSIAAEQPNDKILQLRDNQWNLSASNVANNVVSTQTILNGASYFTIGTQSIEAAENADVSVYPNPSNGSFDILLKGFTANENISVDITDLNGRSLVKQEGQVKDLSTKYTLGQEVASGSYFLRVLRTEKNQTFVQKLLLNK